MRWLSPALSSVACVAVLLLSVQSTGAEPAKRSNPHGKADACDVCHVADDGSVGALRPMVSTCRGCHPTADMHPVDITPKKVAVPQGFVLEQGRLTCATCHYEPGHQSAPAKVVRPWHRQGPYARGIDFCHQCHESTALTRVDPHHPLTLKTDLDGSCTACHTSRPQDGAPAQQAALREVPSRVCSTCHKGVPHAGVAEHLGQPVADGVNLPSHNGTIACFTCHDVHEGTSAGRLNARLPDALTKHALDNVWTDLAGARLPGQPAAHPPMLAAPLEGGALCETCHQEGP